MATSPFPVDGNKQCVDLNTFMSSFGDWTLRTEVQVTYSSFYALIFLVGLIGNGLLIRTIRRRMSVANVFLLNLAISDLLLCITALPITPVLAFVKQWIFGSVLCKLVPLCQGISVLISSYCLCFIALDRFRSIVTPLKMPWGIGYAQALMILCWVCCIAIASPLFMAQRLQLIEFNNMTFCGLFCGEYNWPEGHMQLKLAYGISLLVIQFLVPTAIMTYCYWKILQKVRQDWLVPANSSSTMTVEQQAATVLRKRRVMYVLILMVLIFMGSWMPLTIVNLLRDMDILRDANNMYFKLLNVHAVAMTSIVSNPLLYFWMSKRHRRALRDDINWFTNARRQHQQNVGGLLNKFTPSPSIGLLYRKNVERHLLQNAAAKYNQQRRGTLGDPTCISRERALQEMHANCFLLVPLMPLCVANATTPPALPPQQRPRTGTRTSLLLNSRERGTLF
uniref:G-protein coupled receptors family 1 profile domain-containing protein n=1 Tax=Globodera rostochiensis TaxID=31243 RepID=A0A914HJT5_GLORO